MAGNEWINGYLEAILDGEDQIKSPPPLRERGVFNPARYFVDEVVTGTDEAALYRTWMMATATKNVQERSSRLENLCWRIWHVFRKKKQMEWEGAQRLAKRRLELERSRKDAAEDVSEDLSEAERGSEAFSPSGYGMIKISESRVDIEGLADQHKEKRLYVVMIRYLFVRWGVDVANMTLFVGESGDTDYAELIPGLHKTVILKGAVKDGSMRLIHDNNTYQREDVVPSYSPYIVTTENGYDSEQIAAVLKKLT